VTIKHVVDGDTVVLSDDRHVRLIGINTPETGKNGRPSEAGAEPARDYLGKLLQTNKNLKLHYDRQKFDHYGRTLAHLFLEDGTNLQSVILKRGLATTLIIPPNLEFTDCYEASMDFAKTQKIGLWSLRQYQSSPVEALSENGLGYRVITGKVLRVTEGKTSTWIMLARNVALRISNEELQYFSGLKQLIGKHVVASGLLYSSGGEYRMRIRHPVNLKMTGTTHGD
jgi:Micrococcal nuclease (thermonuclease) homologs